MDSNTHSTRPPGQPDGLATVAAGLHQLATDDLDRLPDPAVAQQLLALRRLLDALDGQGLRRVAVVDARGAAGADQDQQVGSTAAWLRGRLHLGASAARTAVRTARALFCGPLPRTAAALCAGELSPEHAEVLTQGTQHLPDHLTAEAEPVLLDTARRLDPPRLRHAVHHLCDLANPDGAAAARERRHQRPGGWLTPTLDNLVAIDGLLEPRPARPSWPPWSPWPGLL